MKTIAQQILANAEKWPEKTAVIHKNESITYQQLAQRVQQTAAFYKSEGVVKGDRVIISAQKIPNFVYAYFAAHLIGAVSVPIEYKLNTSISESIIKSIQPKLILADSTLNEHLSNAETITKIPFEDYNQLQGIENVLSEDLADIIFTTGTTSTPKGVCLSHQNIISGAVNTNEFIGNSSEDTEVIPLSLHHAFGLRRLRTNLMLGATVILVDGFLHIDEIFEAISAYNATGICLIPAGFAIIRRLTKSDYIPVFKHLKYIEFGSSSLSTDLKLELIENLPGTKLCMHYGLTEVAANIFTEFHSNSHKLEALGKASPNIEIQITDESDNSCKVEEIGEIRVKGSVMTNGYWKNDQLTKSAIHNEWFCTGDLGYKDAQDYIFYKGRKDDMINIGGKKVYPTEIETVLNEYPGIKEAACFTTYDDITGNQIAAIVVLDKSVLRQLDEKSLIAFLRNKLENYKIPSVFKTKLKLPRTASGKIVRIGLTLN